MIQLYFDISYIIVNQHQTKLNEYFNLYNATQYNNINQKLSSCAIKVMGFDGSYNVMNAPVTQTSLTLFQTLVSSKQYLDIQFQSQQFFSSSFIDFYNNQLMVVPLNNSNVSALLTYTEEYSFSLMYTNYEVGLNYLYDVMMLSGNYSLYELMINGFLAETNFIGENVLNNFMYELSNGLYADIKTQNNFIYNFNVIWFAVYTTMLLLVYFLIWRPIEYTLAKDYTRTKLVVLLIPTKIIMKNNKIKDFLIKENLVSIKK